MSYSTALDFIKQFGTSYSAELISDDEHIDTSVFIALARSGDTSQYSALDIDIANAGLEFINYALNESYNEINSYLITRYNLPIDDDVITSSPLRRISCDIARYIIASSSDKMSEVIEVRYKDAIKWLKSVGNGSAQLSTHNQLSSNNATQTAGASFATGIRVDLEGY